MLLSTNEILCASITYDGSSVFNNWYNGVKEFNLKIIRKINGTIDYLLDAIFRHLFCEINLV